MHSASFVTHHLAVVAEAAPNPMCGHAMYHRSACAATVCAPSFSLCRVGPAATHPLPVIGNCPYAALAPPADAAHGAALRRLPLAVYEHIHLWLTTNPSEMVVHFDYMLADLSSRQKGLLLEVAWMTLLRADLFIERDAAAADDGNHNLCERCRRALWSISGGMMSLLNVVYH